MQNITHNRGTQRRGANKSYRMTTEFVREVNKYVPVCETTCAYCGDTKRINWSQGDQPTLITRRWRDLGWDFDPYNSKCVVCPKHKKKTASPSKEEPRMQTTVTPITKPVEKLTRPLTSVEKSKIRSLLDLHFDDEKGAYIDNYSDQRIGKELDIPWASVTQIREAAYGPIREDERFMKLRNDLTNAENVLAELKRRLDDLEKSVKGA